jgi:hypothetical protein
MDCQERPVKRKSQSDSIRQLNFMRQFKCTGYYNYSGANALNLSQKLFFYFLTVLPKPLPSVIVEFESRWFHTIYRNKSAEGWFYHISPIYTTSLNKILLFANYNCSNRISLCLCQNEQTTECSLSADDWYLMPRIYLRLETRLVDQTAYHSYICIIHYMLFLERMNSITSSTSESVRRLKICVKAQLTFQLK